MVCNKSTITPLSIIKNISGVYCLSEFITDSNLVLWSQTSHESDPEQNMITLVFQGENILPSDITLSSTTLSLANEGYACSLEFYGQIKTHNPNFNYDGSYLMLRVQKEQFSNSYWPNLTKERLPYVLTDFDRVRFQENNFPPWKFLTSSDWSQSVEFEDQDMESLEWFNMDSHPRRGI